MTAILLWLSHLTGNLGIGIIVLTILIQAVLLPLRIPSLKSSLKIKAIKPELDALKEQFKGNSMGLAQAQMELYKKNNINAFGGILPILLSIPIIIALYQVLLSTINTVQDVGMQFLWLDVTKPDQLFIIPILIGIAQFIASSQMMGAMPTKKASADVKSQGPEEMAQMMQGQMKYIFPVMSAFITASLPAGVGLYWLTSTLFAIIQQQVINTKYGFKDNTTITNRS